LEVIMQTAVHQGNWQKQWGLLVSKVWSDDNLKQRLIDDPATVLEEHGIEVPYGVELKVVEDTDQVCHLVLPPSPSGDLLDEDLSDSEGVDLLRCRCRCGRCRCFGD
jgi:hypothetical protein